MDFGGRFLDKDQTGQPTSAYYKVGVSIDRMNFRGVPKNFRLMPGMTLSADIKIGRRSGADICPTPSCAAGARRCASHEEAIPQADAAGISAARPADDGMAARSRPARFRRRAFHTALRLWRRGVAVGDVESAIRLADVYQNG